jgi:hypothetical protein
MLAAYLGTLLDRNPFFIRPSIPTLTMKDNEPLKAQHVVFFHPDLGIGGAERLVIDAAVGLQNRGHKVTIFTSHRDRNHCFEEARDGQYSWHTTCSKHALM